MPDEIVPGADVFIVMQNPGENEEEVGRPAVGASGEYLNTHFLPLAGLSRETVSVGNVLKCRWRDPKKGTKTNDLPSKTGVWNEGKKKWDKALGNKVEKLAMAQCMSAHLRVPKHIKLIVTLGEVPAKAIAKVESVTEWRGHLAEMQYENVPVFLSYHPSYLLQSPRMSIPAMIDWKRIKLFLDGKFPEPVPQRTVIGKDQADSVKKLTAVPGTAYVTYDLEWDVETKVPFLAGIAFFNEQGDVIGGVQVWTKEVDQDDLKSLLLWLFWRFPVVMHNAAADLEITKRAWDIGCEHFCEFHDTIQLHAVSHSEWPHDLGFCESLYGRHIRLKGKSKENVLLYNWGDCITTGYTFHQLRQIAKTDPISFKVYQTENLPVIPIRVESKIEGIRLDTQFLSRMSDDLARRAIAAQNIAEMYAGIHVGSPLQVSTYLTKVEKMKLPKSKTTGNESVDKDVIADLRRELLDYDPEEEKDGIDESQLLHNIMAGGHPILEARACYANAYNLRSHYITTLLRKGVPVGREHYDPDEFVSRCYPDQHTHPQSSGRWSTVEP
ncbi:MAG TPA: uracil-DNA glycosylase family protein, partial [Nitrososphaera sp.]|nr:uracil-DNA glycosylase family protein [Nitrososphaera sp.]